MNYYGVLKEVPATVIKPLGFLKKFLMCQKTELSGHREKQGSTFNTPIWNGGVGTLLLRGCLAYDAETVMTPAEKSFAGMRPASPMVRRKRDFFEWEFTKKMNAVGL